MRSGTELSQLLTIFLPTPTLQILILSIHLRVCLVIKSILTSYSLVFVKLRYIPATKNEHLTSFIHSLFLHVHKQE